MLSVFNWASIIVEKEERIDSMKRKPLARTNNQPMFKKLSSASTESKKAGPGRYAESERVYQIEK